MLEGPGEENADALTERMAVELIRFKRHRTRWRRWLLWGLALFVVALLCGGGLYWWSHGARVPWPH